MDVTKHVLAVIASGVLLCVHTPVLAAASKATYFACKDQSVFKKGIEASAGTDAKESRNKAEAYFKSNVATGSCVQLARGEELSVDQKAGNLWCVRPSGDLQCYWTIDKIVDLDPSTSSNAGPSRGSRRH